MAILLVLFTATPTLAEEPDALGNAKDNFTAADHDGDGKLDQTEFRFLIDANAEDNIGRAATISRFGAYNRAFKRVDKNRDRDVAWAEIVFTFEQQQ